MKKRILTILAAVCFMFLLALPVSAQRQYEDCIANCRLYDEDGLFSEMEQEELSRLIRETSDEADLYVAVYILNGSGREMTVSLCEKTSEQLYIEKFDPQYDTDTDGILLFLNLDMPASDTGRYMYIATSGMGKLYYTDDPENDRLNAMMDDIARCMPRGTQGDPNAAVRTFCADVLRYSQSLPRKAFSYDKQTGTYYYAKNGEMVSGSSLPLSYRLNTAAGAVIGALAAALTALITFLVIRSRYKFTKTLSASNYISDRDTTFYQRDDMFIRTHTTKTRIDTNRSGGGGGGVGGGSSHMSGGHSFGGGGRSF